MAKYVIKGPDGNAYEVTAPEGATEEEVMQRVQQSVAAQQRAPAQAPQPPARNRSTLGFVGDVGRAIAQGATFGYADEIAAGLSSLTGLGSQGDGTYSGNLSAERARDKAFQEDHPVVATGAEIGGAVLSPLSRALQIGGGATTLGGRVLAGAGTGGAQGAVYGFGSGEGGVGDRVANALMASGFGAGIGAAAPAIAAGARNLARRVLSGSAADQAGLSRPAYDVLTRAMTADDSLTGPGAQRLAAAGDDAMLADAGPNAMGLLDTAVQRSGPAATMAREAVEGRAAGAGQTITRALDDAFGQPAGVRSTENAIRTGTASARQSAYDAAYSRPIDYASDLGRNIETMIRDRVPPSAIRQANAMMRAEGLRSQQILFDIAEDGTVALRSMPDVRQIDYITRGLNEVADKASAQGKLGGTTATGRIYGNLARDLRNLTREAVPEYAAALETAAEPIAARNALRLGQQSLSPGMARDELAESLRGMTGAERSFVAQGIRSQIDEALANVRRAMTDGNVDARESMKALRDLSSRAARDKVEMVIGPERAASLFSELDRAAMAFEMRAGVSANSRTFARTSLDDTVRGITEDGVINTFRSGRPVNATQRLAATMMGRTEAAKARIADETYSEIVRALTGPRGSPAVAALNQLQTAGTAVPGLANQTGSLAEALARRNAAVTAPLYEAYR